MSDEYAKGYLHDELRAARESMISKLDGLSEYDVRRPLAPTGTNLLGVIKHLTTWEAWYFGEVFGRPSPGPLPWGDQDGVDARLTALFDYTSRLADMWATEHESRALVIERYRRVAEHADATIDTLGIDAPGHVAWWPRPDVKLFNIMVHVLTDTSRHAGQADILREQLDGAVGSTADGTTPHGRTPAFWVQHCAEIERAARAAGSPKRESEMP